MSLYPLFLSLRNNSSQQGHSSLVSSSDWIKFSPARGTLGITGSHCIHQVNWEAPGGKPVRHRYASWLHHLLSREPWINSISSLSSHFQISSDDGEVTHVQGPAQCWTQFVFRGGSGPLPGCSLPTWASLPLNPQPWVPLDVSSHPTPPVDACVQSAVYFCTQHALLHCKLCVNWDRKSSVFAAPHHTPHTELSQNHTLRSVHFHFPFGLSSIFLSGFIFCPFFSSVLPGRILKFGSIIHFATITIMKKIQWP